MMAKKMKPLKIMKMRNMTKLKRKKAIMKVMEETAEFPGLAASKKSMKLMMLEWMMMKMPWNMVMMKNVKKKRDKFIVRLLEVVRKALVGCLLVERLED